MSYIKNYRLEEIEPCRMQIEVEVSKEAVSETFDAVYRDINKEVTIPGFRKGKAPLQLLEKYYADRAQEEAMKRIVSDSYPKIIDEKKLNPVGMPEVSEAHFDTNGALLYKAVVETWPKVSLPVYKGLKIKKASTDVTEEEINEALQLIAEANAQIEANKERKVPSIDDEFAKDLGLGSLLELKDKVKGELKAKKSYILNQQLEGQIFGHLISDSSFDLPKGFLNRQRHYHKERLRVRMLLSGMKDDEADAKINELGAKIDEDTSNQIKLFFILEEIAKKENITITEEEVASKLNELAAKWKTDIDKVRAYFDKNNLWGELVAQLKHSKVVGLLLKEANVIEEEKKV